MRPDSNQKRRALVFWEKSMTSDFEEDIVRRIEEKKTPNDVQAVWVGPRATSISLWVTYTTKSSAYWRKPQSAETNLSAQDPMTLYKKGLNTLRKALVSNQCHVLLTTKFSVLIFWEFIIEFSRILRNILKFYEFSDYLAVLGNIDISGILRLFQEFREILRVFRN
jgi:hypothetical protein